MNVGWRRLALGICLALCGAGGLFSEDSSLSESDLVAPHVIGGTDAPLGKYPWVVALVGRPGSLSGGLHEKQFCTGVLVHPYWVLTAAHCVSDLQSYEYLGVAAGNGNLEQGAMSEHVVDLVVRHHYYAPEVDLEADVALLRLMEPIVDREPIAINFGDELDKEREAARILGWGKTMNNFDEPDQVKRLQEARLSIIGRALANSSAHFNGALSENMIAAGDANPLTTGFLGDSGGPLVVENLGAEDYVLLGITSWGYSCNLDTTPYTVFGSVSKHRDWIGSVIAPDNLELDVELQFAKHKEVKTLDDRVRLQPFEEEGRLGFFLEQSMDGRSNLRLEEGVLDNWFGDRRLRFNTVPGFSPLEDDWNFNFEQGILERKVEQSSGEEEAFLLRVDQEASMSPRPGPYPLSPGMLASGKRLAESSLFGDRTIWFELLGHQAGDQVTFSGWSSDSIGMAIVECDGNRSELVAKNFSENGAYPWGVQQLEAPAKEGMRYFGIVHNTRSFEVSNWINLDRKEIRLNEPISGVLDDSDIKTPRNGHFCEFFEMLDKSYQEILVEVYSEFDCVVQLIELESGKVLSYADSVYGSGTESLVFYRKDANKSLGIRIMNTLFEEMGDYRIEFKRYTKPSELRVGAVARSAIMQSSDAQNFEGQTVYIDYWDLEGLITGRRTYLSVEGFGMYTPSFAVFDVTSGETLYEGFSLCEDDSVMDFVPVAGRRYVLGVAGSPVDLNGNYKVSFSRSPIVLGQSREGSPVKRPKFPMNMRSVVWSSELIESH